MAKKHDIGSRLKRVFAGKPFMKPEALDEAQPFGPSAKIRDFKVYNFKAFCIDETSMPFL